MRFRSSKFLFEPLHRARWSARLLWNSCELDWTPQTQVDSSAARRRSFSEAYRRWPRASVCIPQRTSVAHLIQQLMCRKTLGSQSLLAPNCPRREIYISRCHAPAENKSNSCAAVVWRRKVLICDIETDKEQLARGHRGYPAGMAFHRKKKKGGWRRATCGSMSLWYQSAKGLGSIRV